MALTRCGMLVWLLSLLPLTAATIDVSSQTSVRLGTGDALEFAISAKNFADAASTFGLPEDPARLTFQFVTATQATAGAFSVSLESAGGEVSVALGTPGRLFQGVLHSPEYSGPVSMLSGSFAFSPSQSQALFDGTAALVFRNNGPDLTLGLSGFTLSEELLASLSGGPLTVGVQQDTVALESLPVPSAPLGPSFTLDEDSGFLDAPEPNPLLLVLGGGVALGLVSKRLRRPGGARPAVTPPDSDRMV